MFTEAGLRPAIRNCSAPFVAAAAAVPVVKPVRSLFFILIGRIEYSAFLSAVSLADWTFYNFSHFNMAYAT